MNEVYYVGLDIHKKIIAYCCKTAEGNIVSQGTVEANRKALMTWRQGLPGPWIGAMEATLFTGWIYDFLTPFAVDLQVAHPEMLKAITAAKKKNDRADAEMIADLLRVNLLPRCHMLATEIRELRRVLRYRNHVVRMAVRTQNKMNGLLMEVGASYSKKRLRGKKYFHQLLERVDDIPQSVREPAGYESWWLRDVPCGPETTDSYLADQQCNSGSGQPPDDHRRNRRSHCVDLGA